ncbi:MAG: hypothetical protein LBQ54_09760 [Planctomycetaceae bacterium]|nr:hypothetical protein [Planctomycetaceae bacterium]
MSPMQAAGKMIYRKPTAQPGGKCGAASTRCPPAGKRYAVMFLRHLLNLVTSIAQCGSLVTAGLRC